MPALTASARDRRRSIAEHVAAGNAVPDTATHFGVSVSQVYHSCREHGVKWGHETAGRTLRVIAALLHTDQTKVAIARQHGLNAKRVEVIARQAREAGILAAEVRS